MDKRKRSILVYLLIELIYLVFMATYMYMLSIGSINTSILEKNVTLILISIMAILVIALPPFINRYIVFIYSFLYSLYIIAQGIYFRAFGQYFRFSTVINLYKEAIGASDSAMAFINFSDVIPFIVLISITAVFIYAYFSIQRSIIKPKFYYHFIALIFLIPISLSINSYTNYVKTIEADYNPFWLDDDDFYVYDNIPTTNQFVDKFGILTLGFKDAALMFSEADIDIEAINDFLNDRGDKTTNQMTGIFEGKNVIFIQAESFNDIAVDEELTPTIYKLKNEGIRIDNFNTPTLSGSTSDTEIMANTSLIPTHGGACYERANNTFKTTLASLFKSIGYSTSAYHNCFGDYYNRDIVFMTLGYDNFYDCTSLGLQDTTDDLEVANVLDWYFCDDDNYMAYWITYSGHQPYNLDSTGVSESDVLKVKEKYPNLSDEYVAYLAKNMNLDRALAELMETLEAYEVLDDVVFVFYGDHLVKDIEFSSDSSFYSESGISYRERYTYTDLFFYNTEVEPMVYTKVSTVLDLLPTVANMWNIDYDYNSILGRDIFDEEYGGYYFSDYGSYKTDDFIYNEISGELNMTTDKYSEEEALEIIAYYRNLRNISNDIMISDYFKDN